MVFSLYHFFYGISIDLSYGTDFIVYTRKIEWFWTDPVFVDFMIFLENWAMPSVLSEKHLFRYEQGWPQGQEKGRGMQLGYLSSFFFLFLPFFFFLFRKIMRIKWAVDNLALSKDCCSILSKIIGINILNRIGSVCMQGIIIIHVY